MNAINRMKISTRLVMLFTLFSILAVLIGALGVLNIQKLKSDEGNIYNNNTVSIGYLSVVQVDFASIRTNLRNVILFQNDRETYIKKISATQSDMMDNLGKYQKLITDNRGLLQLQDFNAKYADYATIIQNIIAYAKQNNDDKAKSLLTGKGDASKDSLTKLMTLTVQIAKEQYDSDKNRARNAMIEVFVIGIAGIFLVILLGYLLIKDFGKKITGLYQSLKALKKGEILVDRRIEDNSELGLIGIELNKVVETLSSLLQDMKSMSSSHDAGDIDVRIEEAGYEGAYREVVSGINNMVFGHIAVKKKAMACIAEFSVGNFDAELEKFPGKKAFINDNIERLRGNFKNFMAQMNNMAKQHDLGDIDVYVDEDSFSGAFYDMAYGVNNMVRGHINVKKLAMACVDEFAKGNFDAELQSFPGKKAFINRTIENLRKNLKAVTTDIDKLVKASIEGQLKYRADAAVYEGDWRKLVNSLNSCLDAVIRPVEVAADYVERIGRGDIPAKITDSYNGDFNLLKNNLNSCIENINSLVADANMLAKAAVEGQLAKRADASKHQGDYRKIVEGVNKTLDEVIAPIQEASLVLTEMSNGNLSRKVTGNYLGDNGDIKFALNSTLDSLSQYISEISRVLSQMASANLNITITSDYRGDFASIKDALNLILETFNSVFRDINESADQVASGSSQVADGSQALSQGSTEQASAVEQLTASITQVAAQTRENAVNANKANELALSAKTNAEIGNKHMKEMLSSMYEINESSANISKIIKVIDDIAFQTNILALNAAVEAARAGQHGKGFAVVAEEVRNLAARSANAAKETTNLIEGSIKKAESGTSIANETAKSLVDIVKGVTQAADLVGDIAKASSEQASAIAQINKGIEQVSQVVQTNSATAEESAAASEELSSQAEMLKDMIGRFELK